MGGLAIDLGCLLLVVINPEPGYGSFRAHMPRASYVVFAIVPVLSVRGLVLDVFLCVLDHQRVTLDGGRALL